MRHLLTPQHSGSVSTMDGKDPNKDRRLAVPNVLDVDGFLIDLKSHLGGDQELVRVIESYSTASVSMIQRLLKVIPREDIEWN